MQFLRKAALVTAVVGFGGPTIALFHPVAALAAAATTTFTVADNPGGGHLMKGFLGPQPSLNDASIAMLRALHVRLGARPAVVSAVQNPSQHSLVFFFRTTHNGQQLTGMSLVTAAAGVEATGEAAYDIDTRFPKTIKPMLQTLGAMHNPAPPTVAAAAPIHFAPAEPLTEHKFPDGTGSIGLPPDWTLKGGGGGSAVAVGPDAGEVVQFNFTQAALDPSSLFGQMLINGTGIYPRGQLQNSGLQTIALLHYTGDPVDAWIKSWPQMKAQTGRSEPSMTVTKIVRTGPQRALVYGNGTYGGDGHKPFSYYAWLNETPPSRHGQWAMYFSFVLLPQEKLGKEAATATDILSSVKIDFATLNAHIDNDRKADEARFEQSIANQQAQNAARQASTNASIARANETADESRKQAVGMINYVSDRSVVADTTTGAHVKIDSYDATAFVQANPNFQILAPGQLVKGVDY